MGGGVEAFSILHRHASAAVACFFWGGREGDMGWAGVKWKPKADGWNMVLGMSF